MVQRTFPAGFIAPCLPTKTDKLPSGSQWLHEIKHDGFRIIARKESQRVRLYSRPGNDLTDRFPLRCRNGSRHDAPVPRARRRACRGGAAAAQGARATMATAMNGTPSLMRKRF